MQFSHVSHREKNVWMCTFLYYKQFFEQRTTSKHSEGAYLGRLESLMSIDHNKNNDAINRLHMYVQEMLTIKLSMIEHVVMLFYI